jgi:hypothetical protein
MSVVIFSFGGVIIGWALEHLRAEHLRRRAERKRRERLDDLAGRAPQDS